MSEAYDLIVIGGGSGGLACAQRAAEFGARTVLVESHRLGGTCVNVGCVPKKIMWNAAELAEASADAEGYGFAPYAPTHDWLSIKQSRDAYVVRLNDIYASNLQKRKVELVRDRARFRSQREVEAGGRVLSAPHILIATGGRPLRPDIPGAELGITSDGFFELERRPQRIAIVGSGYVAVELGGIFCALGSQVTMAVRGDRLLRHFDAMIGEAMQESMRAQGITVLNQVWPEALRRLPDGTLELQLQAQQRAGPFDAVLWAIGREPVIDDLNLAAANVSLDAYGFIGTDEWQATCAAGIYAVGDVTGRAQLTPVAIAAGRKLATRLFGGDSSARLDYDNIATVIFGHPPIATLGLSEEQARSRYADAVRTYQTAFTPMYHALTTRKPVTRMKLVTVLPQERVVGCHIVGRSADEMMQGFAVAIRMGATKRDLDETVAIHPTSAEEMVTMR